MRADTDGASCGRWARVFHTLAPFLGTLGVVVLASAILTLTIGVGTGMAAPVEPTDRSVPQTATATPGSSSRPAWVSELLKAGRASTAADPLQIVKTVSDANPYLGDTITYTIWLTNNSDATISNISLWDNLPMAIMSDSITCDGCIRHGRGLTYTQQLPPPAPTPVVTETEGSSSSASVGAAPPAVAMLERTPTPLPFKRPVERYAASAIWQGGASSAHVPSGLIAAESGASCTAGFSATSRSGTAPLTVSFSNTSTPESASSEWKFGDGGTSTDKHPTHTYEDAGVYTVTLTISDTTCTEAVTRVETSYITVCDPITASFTAKPVAGVKPLQVQFTNTSSGTYSHSLWDFGDGETSADKDPKHTYGEAGIYTVRLTVKSMCGSVTVSDTVEVPKNVTVCEPLVASFSADRVAGASPLQVRFSNTSTGAYTTSAWDFGDGETSTKKEPTHTYRQPGFYPVTLTITGTCGTATLTDTVTVSPYITVCEPLTASFTAAPVAGVTPLDVTFANTSKGSYTSSLWDFGDGETSTDDSPTHTYDVAGLYTVTLTISSTCGSAIVSDTVAIADRVTVCEPLAASFTAGPTVGVGTLPVTFTNESTGNYGYSEWDFGDGKISTTENPTHTYEAPGVYTVTLTITGTCGALTLRDVLTETSCVTVYEPARAVFAASPTSGTAPLAVAFTNQSTGDYGTSYWDYGDGHTSNNNAQVHVYTYTQPGIYPVALRVSGLGGTDVLTKTGLIRAEPMPVESFVVEDLEWKLGSRTLAPGEALSVTFSMPVSGLADGDLLSNVAHVQYTPAGGRPLAAMSAPAEATVRLRLSTAGQAQMIAQPAWTMPPLFGVMNAQNWGDMDGDGNLDLAVTGGNGPAVYRNTGAGLSSFWSDYGRRGLEKDVLWADLDGDGYPELVAAGSQGLAVYKHTGAGLTLQKVIADSQLTAVAAGDFDGDGDLDLAVATQDRSGGPTNTFSVLAGWYYVHYSYSAGCPVRLYENLGAEGFRGSGCLGSPGNPLAHAAALQARTADADNDGVPDLALGLSGSMIQLRAEPYYPGSWLTPYRVIETVVGVGWPEVREPAKTAGWALSSGWNAGGAAGAITGYQTPYDLAWGDYNEDGYLDLAVAYGLENNFTDSVYRIYKNRPNAPGTFQLVLETMGKLRALDWGDYNGDGRLELIVGDAPPAAYRWTGNGDQFAEIPMTGLWSSTNLSGIIEPGDSILGMNWVDYDGDGDLDLGLTSSRQPAAVFAGFSPFLPSVSLEGFRDFYFPASSVAWGDADGDGDLDLLFGARDTVGARLYGNVAGGFDINRYTPFNSSGYGPHHVAWGDHDGDGKLDLAVVQESGPLGLVYTDTSADRGSTWDAGRGFGRDLAWGYRSWMRSGLDLLVGGDEGALLYPYDRQAGMLGTEPITVTTGSVTSVAWGDYDQDDLLDIALVEDGKPQVYHNRGDGSFEPVAIDAAAAQASVVAWGDYDGDGRLDLAVGSNPGPLLVYAHSKAGFAPAWQSAESDLRTTSLAWGDWDNDGDLDLAVGNSGQPDRVYLNLSQQNGTSPLVLIWKSAESLDTSDLAWGDMDGDGDLDLAVAALEGPRLYQNTYVRPSHLTDSFARTMPLPNNPAYLSIARPGSAPGAYLYSSPEVLPGSAGKPVAIHYTLYDPDGTRNESVANATGDSVLKTVYEYSLDGGSTWQTATPHANWTGPVTVTKRLGQPATFLWDAVADQAISDDARFRITIVEGSRGGKQRATTSAVSPPFRVRGTTCIWPEYPSIEVSSSAPLPRQAVQFTGLVERASGALTFAWDFGDGTPKQMARVAAPAQAGSLSGEPVYGQVVKHTYTKPGIYTVTLTVRSEACPEPKQVQASMQLEVGAAHMHHTWLPLVIR